MHSGTEEDDLLLSSVDKVVVVFGDGDEGDGIAAEAGSECWDA